MSSEHNLDPKPVIDLRPLSSQEAQTLESTLDQAAKPGEVVIVADTGVAHKAASLLSPAEKLNSLVHFQRHY